MLEEVLRRGFASAHKRLGLVFLDLFWKLIWLTVTLAVFVGAAAWVTSGLRSAGWQDTGVRALNAWIAMALLREFWAANHTEILWALIWVAACSVAAWLILEAVCRSRILNVVAGVGPLTVSPRSVRVYLISGSVRLMVLASAAAILIPVCLAGAKTLAVVIFLALSFFFALLETLIRADAIDLLGTDLIRVTGLVGILMSFEMMLVVSFVLILGEGFLHVASLIEAITMLALAIVVIVLLNVLHSYLLLVRFSAVDIMRRNVIEV